MKHGLAAIPAALALAFSLWAGDSLFSQDAPRAPGRPRAGKQAAPADRGGKRVDIRDRIRTGRETAQKEGAAKDERAEEKAVAPAEPKEPVSPSEPDVRLGDTAQKRDAANDKAGRKSAAKRDIIGDLIPQFPEKKAEKEKKPARPDRRADIRDRDRKAQETAEKNTQSTTRVEVTEDAPEEDVRAARPKREPLIPGKAPRKDRKAPARGGDKVDIRDRIVDAEGKAIPPSGKKEMKEEKEPLKKEPAREEGKDAQSRPSLTIVNFGDPDTEGATGQWRDVLTTQELRNWGRSYELVLEPDSPPVEDGKAAFVSRFGSKIEVKNLARYGHYTMWIDFVHYRGAEKSDIGTRLDIYGDNRHLKSLRFNQINGRNNPYPLRLPYDLTLDGSITVVFRESADSGTSGFWGVWDVIVTDAAKLPDSIESPSTQEKLGGRMKLSDSIVEDRTKMKRAAPKARERGKK